MMQREFTARTNYTPSDEEYGFIEESYYDFNGYKDAFCKAWLEDKASGRWDKELTLRKRIRQVESDFADELDKEKAAFAAKEAKLRATQDILEQQIELLKTRLEWEQQYCDKKSEQVRLLTELSGIKIG